MITETWRWYPLYKLLYTMHIYRFNTDQRYILIEALGFERLQTTWAVSRTTPPQCPLLDARPMSEATLK